MRWTAPPDRREIALVLFSLTVFILSYNIDNSVRLLGFDPEAAHGVLLSTLGFGSSKVISQDGRKPPGWRDALENEIFGSWGWDEGQVAGDGTERSQGKGVGNHNATWIGREATGPLRGGRFGDTTVNEGFLRWEDDIPQSKIVRHVAGYSILDNVIIFQGTVYIVTDDFNSFPPMSSIIASIGPGRNVWEMISTQEAKEKLGPYGGIIRGVTWMSADTTPHNSTLLSLWRTYSSLDPSINSSGLTTLPPPHRLFFPQVRVFTDPNPLPHFHWIRRRRVDTGFHPFLVKSAFPQLTVMYLEDWEDYHKLPVPFVIERIVVADREAAEASAHPGQPVFSPPFELAGSEHWWEPVRQTLAAYFEEAEDRKRRKVVTYLHRQGEAMGLKMRGEDHEALVKALRRLENDFGCEIRIISSRLEETGWTERMGAIVKSTIMLGVYSTDLLDGIFMKPSPQTTLMEFFPADTFARDEELVAHSRGVRYIAWWHDRKFSGEELPPVNVPDETLEVRVDVSAVIKSIRDTLSR